MSGIEANTRRGVNFFDIVEILRDKSNASPNRQEEYIQKAIDYFTSARDCELCLNKKITPYDIKGGFSFASDNLIEFQELVATGIFDKSGFVSGDYLTGLNTCISKLHEIKNLNEFNVNKEKRKELSDFLYTYQKNLNSYF